MIMMTRRRRALLVLSIAWICHGVTIMHQPGWMDADEAIVFELWPLWLRVGIWLVFGALGVGAALSGRDRAEAIGFGLAVIPPLVRVFGYGWSVAAWIVPGAPGGEWLSLFYLGFWTGLLVLVWQISHWPEPVEGGSRRV